MKRILIIYSSGAGSTKTVADIYYKLLNEYQTDILSVSLSFDYSILNRYDLLILAFSCYHNDLNPLMDEFIRKMPKQAQIKKAFAFITYGLYAGNTLRILIKKCIEKNIYVADYADYRAPGTDASLVLPAFKLIYQYEKNIAINIIEDIKKVKRILSTDHLVYKLPQFKLYSILNYPHEILCKKYAKPQIKLRENVCIKCNLCIDNCPRGCWTIGEPYPIFSKVECDTCYKCIHQCPMEALIFSNKTIKKKRMNPQFYKIWKDKILTEIKDKELD